jgi:hypothetical protein
MRFPVTANYGSYIEVEGLIEGWARPSKFDTSQVVFLEEHASPRHDVASKP